jgi:glycosyltransferase involved in cell wall biosynthesis
MLRHTVSLVPNNGTEPGRLVLVSGRDPLRTSGGSESAPVGVAKAAILAGYEPHVFSIAPRSAVLETDFGILHRVGSPVRPARSITAVLQRPWLVPAIVSFLERERGRHVIHCFGAWADPALRSTELLARRGVRTVPIATVFMAIEHETSAKLRSTVIRRSALWRPLHRLELQWVRRVTAPLEARAYRRMWTVVVNYDSVFEILQRPYGPLPIRKLPYSTPSAFDAVRPDGPIPAPLAGFGDPSAPLIVSVSRHDGRKGLDVLIRALGRLRDRGIRFRACLVGPGVLLAAHRRYVRSLGLESQVLVPGRVPEVMPYLVSADVYALPSREEACGSLAVLEALQAGAPIIATAIDGVPEDLEHDGNALLVPADDDEALARGLVKLLEDPALRARLSAQARATYERRFAPEITARALASLYQEAGLAPSRRAASQPQPR